MSFDSKVFRILVASPGDVGEERAIIPEIINEWNTLNSSQSKVILMPVKWETHSAPLLGDRPQAIINEQLVEDCDLLVGVFWTRIGTDTGVSVSGTAEEIEQFVNMKKPVMLYFSQNPIEPDKINIEQFSILKKFKEKMRLQGLTETYYNIPDFKGKFSRQLSLNISKLINDTLSETGKSKSTKTKKTSEKSDDGEIKQSKISAIDVDKESLTSEQVDEYLVTAVNKISDENGWAKLASLGAYLQTYTPVDYREFGHNKLLGFLKSRKLFEIDELKGHPIIKILPR